MQELKQNVYNYLLAAMCHRKGGEMEDYALNHAAKNMVAYYLLDKKAS